MQQEFKTDYVCKIFNVRHITVIDWIKKGRLPAFMTAGGHYRVMRHDLVDFIKKKGRPVPDELKSSETKYRILIVDDEKNIIESVKLMLENMGIDLEIETASDGLVAGIKLGTFMPNLVILDALMSEDPRLNYFDGDTVVKRIKENEKLKNIKILVFTGYPNEGRRLLRMGADKLIEKGSKEADLEVFQKEVCKLLEVQSRKVIPRAISQK